MDLLLIAAIGLALGFVLGLLGGGGAILAIPLLVHVLGQSLDEASTTSLVIVAIGSLFGIVPHARAGRIDWRAGLTFGALGVVGAVVGSRAALGVDDRVQAAGFVGLVVVAGVAMLRGGPRDPAGGQPVTDAGVGRASLPRLLLAATVVGLITGFFGVGGGFIAVPALVFALRMPVRTATATGLVVIAVNALIALAARGTGQLDVPLTVALAGFAAVGGILGALLSGRVPAAALRRGFGGLILTVAVYEAYLLITA